MITPHTSDAESHGLFDRLRSVVEGYGSMVVAYSGGVDSGLLAYTAHRVLGRRALPVIGRSPSLARRDERDAVAFLEEHRIPYAPLGTDEIRDERYRRNHTDRCYYCKAELFAKLAGVARARGFAVVAYGANLDDRSDFRPGAHAAREWNVVAPLVDAGLNKTAVRGVARWLGLSLWDRPASPCLASRIPYYEPVTREKLAQVEEAENRLKEMGFRIVRVRHHGGSARIEVPREDHGRLLEADSWRTVVEALEKVGFAEISLEADGFRSGRLNDAVGKG